MIQASLNIELSIVEKGNKKVAYEHALLNDTSGKITFEELSKDVKQMLIDTAYTVLKEELDRGFPKDFTTLVDGTKGKKTIEEVNPFGSIEFLAPAFALDVIRETQLGLISRTKVVSGNYMKSFQVRVNEKVVANNPTEFRVWFKKLESGAIDLKRDDVIVFVNTAPYARKLERLGITSASGRDGKVKKKRTVKSPEGRSERMLAPNGVFYLTSKAMKRKFPQVNIKFDFISGARLGGSLSQLTFKTHKGQGKAPLSAKEKKNPRTYLYPVILIRLYSGGIY